MSPPPAFNDAYPHFTTQWSAVLGAGRSDTTQARAALEQLCRHYWHPLYAYVRRAGYSREEAEDLTQEFFARLLAQNTIGKADSARGRFRSFLLASLKNFLAKEWDKARAQKRGGGAQRLPLEFDTAETRCAQPVASGDTPDRAFDRQWALTLLSHPNIVTVHDFGEADGMSFLLMGELPLGKFQPPSDRFEVDVRLDEVVLHALEKEPDRRYQHASEVKADVETITGNPTAGAAAATTPAAAWASAARRAHDPK